MAKVNITQTNIKTTKCVIPEYEIWQMLLDQVCKTANIHPSLILDGHGKVKRDGLTVTLAFRDREEGSPPYKVGMEAHITIIQDLNAGPKELAHGQPLSSL